MRYQLLSGLSGISAVRISRVNNNIRDKIEDSDIRTMPTGEKPISRGTKQGRKVSPFGKKTVFSGTASKETLVRKKETYIYCQIGTKLLTSHSGGLLNT